MKRGFYNFKLFDGISENLQSDKIIRIDGERVEGVDPAEKMRFYTDYQWIDLNGLTMLPGLIDAHIHISVPFVFKVTPQAMIQMKAQQKKNFYSCVKYGVTTVRDMGLFRKK